MIASLTVVCQDKEAEAKVYYTNAEEFFNKNTKYDFYQCFDELSKAEKALGVSNSKILFLKIKAMQAFSNEYFAYDLDSAFNVFFKITDTKSYPNDKYSEMIKAKNNFNQEIDKSYFIKVGTPNFKNSAEGWLLAGKIYFKENYVGIAEDYFYKAARHGLAEAPDLIYQVGLKYLSIDYNDFAEKDFLTAANEYNIIPAMLSLGKLYNSPTKNHQDCVKAEQWFKKAANLNNIEAMYRLGLLYSRWSWGDGDWEQIRLGKDLKIFSELYADAIPLDFSDYEDEPTFYSEFCLINNEEVGLDWFIKAAESGDKKSYLKIAILKQFAQDRKVRKRAKEAFEKFRAEKKFVF
jgi:TPR repeat protein